MTAAAAPKPRGRPPAINGIKPKRTPDGRPKGVHPVYLMRAAEGDEATARLTSLEPRVVEWCSPTQEAAFRYGPYPQCTSGGWGSGKTHVYCLKALYLSTMYRKNRGVIARTVAKELRATTMASFYKICPPELYAPGRTGRGKRSDQDGICVLGDTGSEVLFLHLDDPNTEGVIRGLEINWFLIDQAEENPDGMEQIFDMLLGRLSRWDIAEVPDSFRRETEARTGQPWKYRHPETHRPVPPPYAMLCCNPDAETHWIYRRFHPASDEHQAQYASQGYRLFHMPSRENRFLAQTNLDYLLAHDTAFIRRNVDGIWGFPEGSIHLVDDRSIVAADQTTLDWIRSSCRLYRTLDHGDSSPTCCLWWAVDREGNAIAYREYYLGEKRISEHREAIAALSEGEDYEDNLADPSIFHQLPQRQGGRSSIADEYADCTSFPRTTALFWHPADNNELSTRNRINEALCIDPQHLHPFTRERGAPRVFFLERSASYPHGCFHAIRQLRAQKRVRVGTDLGRAIYSDARDETVVDHAYDPIRYFMASRPAARAAAAKTQTGTFTAVRRMAREYRRWVSRR